MMTASDQTPAIGLADVRRVLSLVGEIRALRGQPAAQRRRARAAVEALVGRYSDYATLYGSPTTRRLRWFLEWMGEERPGPASHLPHWRRQTASTKLLRLFVSELYRLHRDGQLDRVDPPLHLPPRQQQVLEGLLRGAAIKQIALELGLSRRTVEEYYDALCRRLAVSSRSELMALFVRHGGRRPG